MSGFMDMSNQKQQGTNSEPRNQPVSKTGYGSYLATNLEQEVAELQAAGRTARPQPTPKVNRSMVIWASLCVGVMVGFVGLAILFNNLRQDDSGVQVETNPPAARQGKPMISGRQSPEPKQKANDSQKPRRFRRTFNGDPVRVN